MKWRVLINVSDVLEHTNCVSSSRMRKRTHDAEFVQPFWIQQETTPLPPKQRKTIELICEGVFTNLQIQRSVLEINLENTTHKGSVEARREVRQSG